MIIYIPGDPVGKQRPRMVNGHMYTPQRTKDYQSKVAWAWKQAGGSKLEGPVLMRIVWHYPIPKRTNKANRAAMLKAEIMPTTRPDLDNVCKSIMDGLNGVAYDDDSQIVSLTAIKRYAEDPGVFVEVDNERLHSDDLPR